METVRHSETSVNFYQTPRFSNHVHRNEKKKRDNRHYETLKHICQMRRDGERGGGMLLTFSSRDYMLGNRKRNGSGILEVSGTIR
jgi:hypothetical protein